MIKKTDLLKKELVYKDLKRFFNPKQTEHFKIDLMGYFLLKKHFTRQGCTNFEGVTETKPLKTKTFLDKKMPFYFLKGFDVVFISKTGKNLFISWLNPSSRLIKSKSLMTLNDPKNNRTKKQKGFSAYFLLKKFCTTLRRRHGLERITLLLRGSLGIRRKKAFASGVAHSGLKIKFILDITNVPFNGCRLKKARRS